MGFDRLNSDILHCTLLLVVPDKLHYLDKWTERMPYAAVNQQWRSVSKPLLYANIMFNYYNTYDAPNLISNASLYVSNAEYALARRMVIISNGLIIWPRALTDICSLFLCKCPTWPTINRLLISGRTVAERPAEHSVTCFLQRMPNITQIEYDSYAYSRGNNKQAYEIISHYRHQLVRLAASPRLPFAYLESATRLEHLKLWFPGWSIAIPHVLANQLVSFCLHGYLYYDSGALLRVNGPRHIVFPCLKLFCFDAHNCGPFRHPQQVAGACKIIALELPKLEKLYITGPTLGFQFVRPANSPALRYFKFTGIAESFTHLYDSLFGSIEQLDVTILNLPTENHNDMLYNTLGKLLGNNGHISTSRNSNRLSLRRLQSSPFTGLLTILRMIPHLSGVSILDVISTTVDYIGVDSITDFLYAASESPVYNIEFLRLIITRGDWDIAEDIYYNLILWIRSLKVLQVSDWHLKPAKEAARKAQAVRPNSTLVQVDRF